MSSLLTVRRAVSSDVPAITEIYNDAITNSIATMDTIIQSVQERRAWLEGHGEQWPVIVCDLNGEIAGWASLTQWSNRPAYSQTAEASVFVHKRHRAQGIGKRLLQELIVAGEKVGMHLLVARIATSNTVSLNMCRNLGFTDVGVMKEAGHKFGSYVDISVLQYLYS
ncbi:N-acetyltransferase family protein [bacterium]|nr:MAG: N-acetyltransferase family protein [bacterium]